MEFIINKRVVEHFKFNNLLTYNEKLISAYTADILSFLIESLRCQAINASCVQTPENFDNVRHLGLPHRISMIKFFVTCRSMKVVVNDRSLDGTHLT